MNTPLPAPASLIFPSVLRLHSALPSHLTAITITRGALLTVHHGRHRFCRPRQDRAHPCRGLCERALPHAPRQGEADGTRRRRQHRQRRRRERRGRWQADLRVDYPETRSEASEYWFRQSFFVGYTFEAQLDGTSETIRSRPHQARGSWHRCKCQCRSWSRCCGWEPRTRFSHGYRPYHSWSSTHSTTLPRSDLHVRDPRPPTRLGVKIGIPFAPVLFAELQGIHRIGSPSSKQPLPVHPRAPAPGLDHRVFRSQHLIHHSVSHALHPLRQEHVVLVTPAHILCGRWFRIGLTPPRRADGG